VRSGALVAIGVWLGLLVASWLMATASFRNADRLVGPEARAEFQARLAPLSADDRRVLVRYHAAESNRWMFRTWGTMQLVLAVVLVALTWRLGAAPRFLALAVAAMVVVQAAAIVPPVAQLGRSLDFVPRPLPPAEGRRFGLLHTAYMVADLLKAGGLAAAALIIARRAP
jgi:hypothetical protein